MTNLQPSLKANKGDQIFHKEKSRSFFWIILICLLALTIAGIYFYYINVHSNVVIDESDEILVSEKPSSNILEAPTPDIPYIPSPFVQDQTTTGANILNAAPDIAEPRLTEEEAAIRMRSALSNLSDPPLFLDSFYTSNPLQRIAAIVDSSSKGIVIPRLLLLKPLQDKFRTIEQKGVLVMDPSGYVRFDPYVERLVSLDTNKLKELFHKYRPYLEQAYAAHGYQQEAFDNAIMKSLDEIISATPINAAIAIQRHEAIYRFVDEDLEALSEIHKQLLRMGPDNMKKIQSLAKDLRLSLLEKEI